MGKTLIVVGGIVLVLILVMAFWIGGSYNSLVAQDEAVTAASAEVINQYKRRADLIPQLVETVKGFAEQEREVFRSVTEARSQVGRLNVTAEQLSDPATLELFQQAQQQLSGALSRLIAVAENYPNLKSDAAFRDLQAQLEGTENRIAVARNRFIQAVQEFNTRVRRFPTNLVASMFGFERKATFSDDDESIRQPPQIDFSDR